MAEERDRVGLAVQLASAYLSNSNIDPKAEDVQELLRLTHAAVTRLEVDDHPKLAAARRRPAVPVVNSVQPDALISLIDGKRYKTLRRHLNNHGFTPESYRAEFGLDPDYPMVAAAYAEERRSSAKRLGLGTNGGKRIRKSADRAESKA